MMNKLAVAVIALLCPLATAAAQPYANTSGDRERLIGAWHLVKIDSGSSDPKSASAPQPLGILIYTPDGHMSVQLMYPEAAHAPDNEYVRSGYEASFGSYEVDEAKHTVTHHVKGSITRNLLVGKDLPRRYQLTGDGHLIIRAADPREYWSVTWEHY
jgi:hypothetical protein